MSEAPPSPSREAAPSVYVDPLWQERAKHLFRSGPQAELIKGNPCYVPHDEQVFQPATIVNPNSAQVRVRTEDGEEITVPRAKVYCASDLGPEGVEDMTLLKHLHEPTIIDNLNLRFKARKIYSFVGSILVSVNPYTNVPIYTPSIARMYDGKPVGQLPPHIYAIADAAYAARGDGKNQSIYISGESGAGKTEAVKLILSYLTRISGKDRKQLKTSVTPQQRIMSTNPILEAFGNAKTLRNNNSSRFAKMIDVLFDETGYIVGGRVSNYLLEKSRVVSQAPSERNFHSFYYLLAGCDKTERAVWGLYDAKHYRFTNQTRVYEIKSVDSKQQYMALKRAMTVGGISLHQQHLIFTLLASILHMGNVRFFGEDEARIRNMEVVKWVAHLLKMDVNALSNALLFREATIGDETVQVPLSVAKAKDTRDSFASVLYSRNFDWLVNRLNRDMETDQYHTKISLLDIFGFEEYETNAFEQFCINYANERLQLEFNDHIFRQEMAEYIAEDIDVSKFNFEDNQPALDIIQRADNGLLTLLDGESFSPTGTDSSFLVRMRRAGDFLPTQQRWHTESVFAIKHYAGEVVYSVSGFLETNRQHFSSELLKAVRTSRLEHLKGLFEGMEESVHRKDKAHLSLSSQFREQLDGMMEHLSSAAPQYIRCIKPNSVQSSEIFDRFDVLRQLRCSGVMDTIRIRKDGYPFRQTQEDFLDRYGVLLPADLELREEEPQARAAELLAALGVTDERYQIGLTKVFLKDDLHHHLEGRRAHYYNSAAVIIQAHLKGFVQRRQYMRLRASCETLQYWFREYLVAVDVSEEVDAHLGALRSGSDMKGSVAALGALASRQANVRTIVGAGGIETIVGALGDGDDADMVSAGAKTLSAMAKADALHSTSIARSGAVTTMVSNIHASDAAQAHSIGLIGDLAEVDRNIGLVVREGGVDALTESMRKNARGEQSDYQLSRAALALGNLSKNKRVVRMIGSDHQAILAVIDGINAKPKYARLTQYSINCLANFAESRDNVDSIVDLGGIETMVAALKNHSRNEEVLREIARTFNEVARNPMYAKRIGELGTIELALRVLEDDPAYCGEHALAIIQAVCAHPANTSRLLRANGVSKFLALLASGIDNENVLTIAMRMLAALCQDPSIAIQVVDEDGSHTIHHSLNEHKEYAAHNRHAISALVELAEHHPDTKESLKGMDVVTSIALAMERHAEDEQLVQVGKAALGFLADQQDLENAVDVAARSRMKDQTERNLLVAGRAIVVISALALIEENIEYIASESGIPILLSIINGTSASVSDRIADQVLVPSIRAVARLLVDENNVDELISEGGVQSLVQALTGQSDKERACQVCTLAIDALIESNAGFLELVKHQGLEALVTVLAERSDFEAVVLYILALMAKIARTKSNGIRWLVERGALEAIIRVLQEYAQSSQTILKSCTLLLLLLSSSKRVDKQRLYVCADLALGGVRVDPSDAEVIISTLKFVFKLSRDPDGAAYMQEKGSAATILMLLDEHYGHAELTALGTQLLGNITRNQELLDALESLYALAQDLVRNPEDETIMQSMVSPVTLIGSMASNPKAASVIVQNQGLDTLSRALMAAEEAKKCIEQEKLLKHLAFTLSRIASHRRHTEAIVLSGCVQHTLEAVGRHIDYEEFVEEVQIGLENLSRSPEAISYLIDAGTPKTVQAMVAAHPLNDKILVSATRFLVRLAKGCELKVMRRIRKEGFQLALVGVGRFMSAEDHIIDALHNVGRLATLSHDGTHVVVGAKAIALFQQVMKKHVNSPAVVTAATQAFSALADNPDFATALMTESIADQVIAGLDMYGDNEDYCARAIAVLYKMALVPENIAYLEEKGAAGLCMETMARHAGSEMVQLQSLLLMSALARDKEMSRALANTGAIRMVFNAVRAHPLSPPVVQAGVSFARAIAAVPDNIPALVAERASEMTQWAVRAYPQNAQLQTVCKETLELLETALPEQTGKGDEEEDEEEIDVAIPGLAAMEGRDSRRVVKKLVSIVKVIKNPIDDNALREALVKLSDSKASQDTLDEMMKYGGLARLVAILDANTANAPLVCAVVKCLLRFADKGEHINLIVAHGAIGALLRAMVAHAENPDLTALGVRFIGKLSVYNRLKVLIGLQGGVQVLLAAMERFIAIAPLINRTTYCLGNMASNCLPNRRAIIKGGGVGFICFAMQKHRSFLDLVINAARALSPLCADDDASRQSVAKSGASLVIIRAVLHQPQNPGLLQNGLNCLHKISKRKDTLPTLIHQQAVQAVVAGMNAYAANTELQQFGMEILSNLSSHRSRETNPVLTQGGTITAVIKSAIRHHKHTRIQIASYECLQNLASSNRDAEEIVKTGFVNKLLDSLSAPRAQEKLLEEGVSLLTVLASKSEMNAKDLIECGAVEVLVELLRKYNEYRETMRLSLVCLSKLSMTEEHAGILARKGVVNATVEAMLDREDDDRFLVDALKTLVNMALLESNAIAISETAIEPIIASIDHHFSSQAFLRAVYMLLSNLSMWPRASKHLIEQGMIAVIVATMRASTSYPAVVSKMVRVLTNFTLVQGSIRLLKRDGAVFAVREVSAMHANHIQLKKAADAFLLKVVGKRKETSFARAADLITYVKQHVTEHNRNLLTSGWLFTRRSKDGAKPHVVAVTLDFEHLTWSDPKNKSSQIKSMPIRNVSDVVAGACTEQLRTKAGLFGNVAVPEHSFAIFSSRDNTWSLSLEAEDQSSAAAFVLALQQLIQAHTAYTVGLQ